MADGPGWTPERLFRSYIEFFETSNEYVEYPLWGTYNQGRWRIYGLDLPGEVLEKIYVSNAARLIPSRADVAERLTGGSIEQRSDLSRERFAESSVARC